MPEVAEHEEVGCRAYACRVGTFGNYYIIIIIELIISEANPRL
jgi:hypothetical protein